MATPTPPSTIPPGGITPPPSASDSNVSGIPNRCSPARRRKKLTKVPPTPTPSRFPKSNRHGRARPRHPLLKPEQHGDAWHKAGHDEPVSVDTSPHRPTLALFRGELR